MNPTILTANGYYFNLLAPEQSPIHISDIAHALANLCRFTGHTQRFYSVAQHSVMVSNLVPPQHALAGLLHDAAEAYLGDVSSPLKALLPEYRAIEARVEAAVLARFGLPHPLPACVKHADLVALATEKRDVMHRHAATDPWPCLKGLAPARERITPFVPAIAEAMFLRRYMDLTDERVTRPATEATTQTATAEATA